MVFLGPLFGLRALIEIKARPEQVNGRGLAWSGIIVGLAALALWILGAAIWHHEARMPMLRGPEDALWGGSGGNIAQFKAAFAEQGAHATDDEARAFLAELSRRYGNFLRSNQATGPQAVPASLSGPASLRIRYTLMFDQRPADAEAAFVTFAPSRFIPKPVFKWGWIRVIDPRRGDLIYPASAHIETAATAPSTTSQPLKH